MVVPAYLFAERPEWVLLAGASFLAFFFVTGWLARREGRGAKGDIRDRGSKAVIYIFTIIAYAGCFWAPALFPEARIDLPPAPVFYTGLALLWAGLLLYVWAVATLGAFFRTTVQLLDGQKLVRRGPYRVLRHPAYTGGIILFAGVGILFGNWISVAAAVLSKIIAYSWRIHVEEAALAERFGAEFADHKRRTWAVIPFVW